AVGHSARRLRDHRHSARRGAALRVAERSGRHRGDRTQKPDPARPAGPRGGQAAALPAPRAPQRPAGAAARPRRQHLTEDCPMRDVLQTLLPIARAAADVISRVYRTPFDVDYKGPSDPVTVADREANELICAALRDRYPDVPIVAEESDPATFADFRSHRHVFFVDPLDGTREFVKRNGQFVVMIGLLADERALAGVIHVPDEDRAYAGVVGEGAFV